MALSAFQIIMAVTLRTSSEYAIATRLNVVVYAWKHYSNHSGDMQRLIAALYVMHGCQQQRGGLVGFATLGGRTSRTRGAVRKAACVFLALADRRWGAVLVAAVVLCALCVHGGGLRGFALQTAKCGGDHPSKALCI